jgi:hypothetical protein
VPFAISTVSRYTVEGISNANIDADVLGIHRIPVNWYDQDGEKEVIR